jgi:DNA repair exonuclease SbcCD ATPase subunit
MGASGKTTIFDALRLCLYGKLEFDHLQPYVTYEHVADLEIGETGAAELSVVLSDTNGAQYRINRTVRTVMTSRGAENDIEDASIETTEDGEWTCNPAYSTEEILNRTLPEVLEPVIFYNGETSLGIKEEWVESIGITELAEIVQEASQNYPDAVKTRASCLSTREKTIETLLDAANSLFSEMTFRGEAYLTIDSEDDQPKVKIVQEDGSEYLPSAGEQMITSMSFLLAFAEIMPVTPPLIFDGVLGRADRETRERMLNQLSAAAEGGQVILMSFPHSIQDLPEFEVSEGNKIELEPPDLAQ